MSQDRGDLIYNTDFLQSGKPFHRFIGIMLKLCLKGEGFFEFSCSFFNQKANADTMTRPVSVK